MKTGLGKNINDTFNELDNILFSFSEEQLNETPFEGSWTGGQVTEHIIKSLGGISRLMNGPVEDAGRDPGEKIKALEDLFLNFNIKMRSPDFILPEAIHHKKNDLLKVLADLKKEMLDASKLDLSLLCTGAEFPTFGHLTRMEWLHFFLVHTQRHTQQLKNIFHTLKQTV
ncbi:MAG TPA: DinB family protein [Chitinophagaceae bacterium]|nr:DinB family protein [Chitinophagaceae bacterium]